MKKMIAAGAFIMSAMIIIQCNNSGTGETTKDTAAVHTDTANLPVVTEGGLKDSMQIGASDTTKRKDSLKK